MQMSESAEFVHVQSPFFAMACAKRFPMIAQLGVESGGRTKRHVEQNLLKPGLGGTACCEGKGSFGQPCLMQHSAEEVVYRAGAGAGAEAGAGGAARGGAGLDWRIVFRDERTFVVRLRREGGRVDGEFFRIAFSTEICPVSVWGDVVTDRPFPPKAEGSVFDVPDITVDYRAGTPLLLHFPDYGAMKVTCENPSISARQTMSADPGEVGLNLGCTNTGYHTRRRALHCGTVTVSFHAQEEVDEVELVFSVEKEHYPQMEGVDFSDAKWDGLKRCWQNSFTLDPRTLSMGDNIMLHGIAHLAIHFKSDMSVFTPPLLEDLPLQKFFHRVLEITFRDCVGDSGEIHARHASPEKRGKSSDFGFFDANISNLIALYNYIAATGDWSIAREHLENIRRAGKFLLALDRDGDGILELPYDGNAFREDRECRNWWDNFPFGHKDAFINLLAYRGLGNLAEILQKLGQDEDAKDIARLRERFAASFHRMFFNPATGVHCGWVSADGRMHDYMFTFISSMAINEGLVEEELSRQILGTLLAKLRAEGYGQWKWGIPGPLISVSEADGHIWEPMQRWGSYENGGFCGQTAYHFIQALYQVGMREQADEILFAMMATFEKEFTHSGAFPGYMRSVDWRTKEGIPCGYNYLADNYYFLLAAVTGHYGRKMPGIGDAKAENAKG